MINGKATLWRDRASQEKRILSKCTMYKAEDFFLQTFHNVKKNQEVWWLNRRAFIFLDYLIQIIATTEVRLRLCTNLPSQDQNINNLKMTKLSSILCEELNNIIASYQYDFKALKYVRQSATHWKILKKRSQQSDNNVNDSIN